MPAYNVQLKELMAVYANKDKLVNLLTMATCSTLLNACFVPKDSSISKVASEITKAILQEANLEKFIVDTASKGENIEKICKSYGEVWIKVLIRESASLID